MTIAKAKSGEAEALVLLLSLVLSACKGAVPEATVDGTGGHTSGQDGTWGLPCDIQSMFAKRCLRCHGSIPFGGAPRSLVTYDDLTRPDPDLSPLTEAEAAVLRMESSRSPMPPERSEPATQPEIVAFQNWITKGYPKAMCSAGASGNTDGGGGGAAAGGTGGVGGGGGAAAGGSAGSTGGSGQGGTGGGGGDLANALLAWYRCDQAFQATLPDASGNNNNGILMSSTTDNSPGYSFSSGKVNDALNLQAAKQSFVALPEAILAGSREATIATWVRMNSNSNFQRVWDFGSDTNAYMFLTTVNARTNVMRFGITINGNAREEVIDGPAPLPIGQWKHVVVVLGPSGGILYLDGAQVGTNTTMMLRPSDLGRTTNNYIGRSQFSIDPYLDGSIDEFRIYNRALSPEEIRTLYNDS